MIETKREPYKYEVTVNKESITVHGKLKPKESLMFVRFYKRLGYKKVLLGTNNTALTLLKE